MAVRSDLNELVMNNLSITLDYTYSMCTVLDSTAVSSILCSSKSEIDSFHSHCTLWRSFSPFFSRLGSYFLNMLSDTDCKFCISSGNLHFTPRPDSHEKKNIRRENGYDGTLLPHYFHSIYIQVTSALNACLFVLSSEAHIRLTMCHFYVLLSATFSIFVCLPTSQWVILF